MAGTDMLSHLCGARVAVPAWAHGCGEIETLLRALREAGWSAVQCLGEAEVLEAGYAEGPVVAIGNLNDSLLLRDLYMRRLAFIDSYFPGPDGFAVCLLSAPTQLPHPIVIAGGSDRQGTHRALSYLTRMASRRDPGFTHVESLLLPPPPEPSVIAGVVERVISNQLALGNGYGPAGSVIEWCFLYHLSRKPGWGNLAREALLALAEGYAGRSHFGPYGKAMWEFFFLHGLITIWRLLEADTLFSDTDRTIVRGLLEDWAGGTAGSCYLQPGANPPGEIRQNHALCAAVSMLDAVEYLSHYADVSRWRGAQEQAEVIVEGQLSSYRPNDDGGNDIYAWNNPAELLHLLLPRHDLRLLESGQLARIADLAIVATDNRKDDVSYGDCLAYRPWRSRSHVRRRYVLGPAAWFYRNEAYQWVYQWLAEQLDPAKAFSFDSPGERWDLTVGRYASDVPATYPQGYCGIRALLLDKGALATMDRWYADAGRAGQVPFGTQPPLADDRPLPIDYAQWRPRPGVAYFDKISFRPSFEASDEYLLLQGPGTFCHGHRDANAIARLTWKDRIWLIDLDYIRYTPQHHNLVHVVRKGQGIAFPPLAALERLCNFDGLGITCTKLASLNGADWIRTIIWMPGQAFLILDDLTITQEGAYEVECLWRPLGQTTTSGHRLDVRQGDLIFSILCPPDPALASWLTRERRTTKSILDAYQYADPKIDVWHQLQTGEFGPGHHISFANLLCAPAQGTRPQATLHRLAGGLLGVQTDGEPSICGAPAGPVSLAGVEIEAGALFWTRERLCLAGARQLWVRQCHIVGQDLFDLDLNLASGSGLLYAAEATLDALEFAGCRVGPPAPCDPGPTGPSPRPMVVHRLHLREEDADLLKATFDCLQGTTSQPQIQRSCPEAHNIPDLVPLWQQQMDAPVSCCAGFDQGRLFGDTSGGVHLLEPDGRRRWSQSVGGAVRGLLVAHMMGNGQPQIAAGTDDGQLHLLSTEGQVLWSCVLPPYHAFGDVQRVTVLNALPTSGGTAGHILVGTEGHHLFCVDSSGAIIWHQWARYHAVTALAVGDLLGSGQQRIVLGTEYQTPINVLDADGNLLWFTWEQVGSEARSTTVRSGADARAIRLVDVNGDGLLEIVYGTMDMLVLALDPRDGTHVWKADVGGEVVGLELWPAEKDGVEIAVLTDNGLLHLLGSDGRSLAFRRVDRSATSLACCDTSAIAVAGMAGITLLGRDLIPLARLAGDTLPTALASVAGQSEPRLLYAAGRMIGEIVYPLWQQGGERTGGLVHDSGG